MKHETEILRRAERMSPLIHSIMGEVRNRAREIERLQAEQAKLLSGPGEPIDEIRSVEFELFCHRRGIELVQKELARLGCSLDPDHPERIVWSVADSEVTFEHQLDETGYRTRG